MCVYEIVEMQTVYAVCPMLDVVSRIKGENGKMKMNMNVNMNTKMENFFVSNLKWGVVTKT